MPNSVLRAVLGRMQFALHATRRTPYGASRLVQALSAWLMKTRRAPSRHSRDARVYGHKTTAMHKLSTPPPSPTKAYGHTTTTMHKLITPPPPPSPNCPFYIHPQLYRKPGHKLEQIEGVVQPRHQHNRGKNPPRPPSPPLPLSRTLPTPPPS